MSCPGLHCPGCGSCSGGGGQLAAWALLAAAATGVLSWLAARIWWIAGAAAGALALAILAAVLLRRAMHRMRAADLAQLAATHKTIAAERKPQVTKVTPTAITNHYHGPEVHFHGAGAAEAAVRAMQQAIPGQAGDAITGRNER